MSAQGMRAKGTRRLACSFVLVHLDHVAPDLEAAGLRGTFYVPGHSESLAKRLREWRALFAYNCGRGADRLREEGGRDVTAQQKRMTAPH